MKSSPLDAKALSRGMRVITKAGVRRTGTVKAVNVVENWIAILFDGDTSVTPMCQPRDFAISPPNLRLTGQPPPHTVPR